MWIYTQKTGELRRNHLDGPVIAVGYAGAPSAKNSTSAESVKFVGPIPRGLYLMGAAKNDKDRGSYCIPLAPDNGNEMYGRSQFLIHADSVSAPGTASQGCIILGAEARKTLADSKDRWLVVI